jgi:sensor domain CHASE-containing protein
VAFVVDNSYVRIFLGLIASAVTWHIVSRKALVQDDKQELLEIQELVESELNNENSVLSHENINTEET